MDYNNLITALNVAVVIIFTVAYIPQLVTLFKSDNRDGISSSFWTLVSISTIFTLHNVLETGNAAWYVYLGQFINAGVATFIYLSLFVLLERNSVRYLFNLLGMIVLVLAVINFASHDVIQSLATFTIVLAYIDQIRHFINVKDSRGTNPALYILFAIGLSLLLTIFVLTDVSLFVVVTEATNIVLLLTCAFLSVKYGLKNKDK